LIGVDQSYSEVDDGAIASGGTAAGIGGDSGNAGIGGDAGTAAGASGGGGQDAAPDDAPSGPEDCGNAIDDDKAGRVDCFDVDCAESALCTGTCSDVATLPCNTVLTAQNSGAAGATQRSATYACSGAERPGPELAYRFRGAGQVFVELYGLSADLGLFLTDVPADSACDSSSGCREAADLATGSDPEALSFSTVAGRDYFLIVDGPTAANFSISVQCTTDSGCAPARAIQAGQSIDASNAMGEANVTNNLVRYSCASGDRTFPEAAFVFTPPSAGDYTVSLRNQTTNFDLFVVAAPNCSATCLHGTARSISPSGQDEALTFSAAADRSYYIVVDGYGNGSFTLAVTAL